MASKRWVVWATDMADYWWEITSYLWTSLEDFGMTALTNAQQE
jgi:hypothetical protein